jgi:hypothetical protein
MFCQRLIAAAAIRPDKVAMMLIGPESKETITFSSLLAQIRSIASRLSQERIDFGDRVPKGDLGAKKTDSTYTL